MLMIMDFNGVVVETEAANDDNAVADTAADVMLLLTLPL